MRRAWPLAMLALALAACSRKETVESRAPARSQGHEQDTAASHDARRAERLKLVGRIEAQGVKSPRVLAAMRAVQRHAFVPDSWAEHAYEDRPLPIGHGQTISQPTVVAAMTEAVAPADQDKCLEIGTGSGYQAAVLAQLCARVFSIEYLAPLAAQAERALRRAGYAADRVVLRTGDGYVGWPEAAPFEVIVVTAAPEQVPQPLLDQLALGGRLVIPVGQQGQVQELVLYRRREPGHGAASFEKQTLMQVQFVPFLGEASQGQRQR